MDAQNESSSLSSSPRLQAQPPVDLQRFHSLEFVDPTGGSGEDGDGQLDGNFDIDELMDEVARAGYTSTLRGLAQSLGQDMSGQDSAGSPRSETSAATSSPTINPKRARRVTSKQHIAQLRELVKRLTRELRGLQGDQTRASGAELGGKMVSSSSRPLWQHIAMRQRDRRRKAEADNDMLREMVMIQSEEAASLRRILTRRHRIKLLEDMLCMRATTSPVVPALALPADNEHILHQMLLACDELYNESRAFFIDNGIVELSCPGRKRLVKCSILNGTFFDLTLRNRIPFGLDDTVSAVWNCITGMRKRGEDKAKDFKKNVENHVQQLQEDNDVLTSSFYTKTPWFEGLSGAQIRSVSRKYVEEDRVVIIRRMVIEPKLKGSNLPAGFQDHATTRIVIQREESQGSNENGPTQLWINFSAARQSQGTSTNVSLRGPINVNFGISLWDELVSRIPDDVETYLIDRARFASAVQLLQK